MTEKDLPLECYPATVRLSGSTVIRDDRDLIEIVGRMCGDDVRDVLRERLEGGPRPANLKLLKQLVEKISSAVGCIDDDVRDIYNAVDDITEKFL